MIHLEKFVSISLSESCWTPDLPYLGRMFTHVPVFVYNQFRDGMGEHGAVEGMPLVGFGKTQCDFEVLFTPEKEPLAFPMKEKDGGVGVQGEVYQVSIPVLTDLDRLMCNTLHVTRQLVDVTIATSKSNSQPFKSKCWMYIGNENELRPFMNKFTRANTIVSDNNRFFMYTTLMELQRKRLLKGAL